MRTRHLGPIALAGLALFAMTHVAAASGEVSACSAGSAGTVCPPFSLVADASVLSSFVAAATAPADPSSVDETPQTTATVGPQFGELARVDHTRMLRAVEVGTWGLTAGPTDHLREAAERVRSDVLPFSDRELYALLAGGLVAVLSLSRRRNL